MSGYFDALLFLEAVTVVLAGGLILYTTLVYGAMVLFPRATGLLGGALVVAGVGTTLSLAVVPGGETHTLGFISVAGVGFCLAGWQLTSSLVDSEQFVGIDSLTAEETEGFGGDR